MVTLVWRGGGSRGGGTPPCDIPLRCCFFTGPWTVTRSSLRMLRRVAAFCRPRGGVRPPPPPAHGPSNTSLRQTQAPQQVLPGVRQQLLHADAIVQVGAVEGGGVPARLGHAQRPRDVVAGGPGGGGREGQDREARAELADDRQLRVRRAEAAAPFGDAVRLVHGEEAQARRELLQHPLERRLRDLLRAHVEHVQVRGVPHDGLHRRGGGGGLSTAAGVSGAAVDTAPLADPLCDIPLRCCLFTGPWTVTRSSLRMLRRVAAFCRPLRPVLLLVLFPRSGSPVVGVLGLC